MIKEELDDGMQVIEGATSEEAEVGSSESVELNRLTPKKVMAVLKSMLRSSIYEEDDFKMGKNSVSIDLQYDSKYTRNVYFNELRKKFPGMTTVTGTKIKIAAKTIKDVETSDDSGNSAQVKKNRRDGTSKKSLPRNEKNPTK